jgi:glycosyltransferase involved in cell wall biosynthesis
LALSVMWRHVTEDPVRALLLGWRVLPGRVRPWLRWAGPYGPATVAWGSGQRKEALARLDTEPRRLASFALAVDRPEVARRALDRMPAADPARALLLARLAGREGRLRAGVATLDGVPGRKQAKVLGTLSGELYLLEEGIPRSERLARRRGSLQPEPGRVLHLVTDALPTTSAGYTIRTHEIVRAQRAAGLDPHVVTRCGYPVTAGKLDGRRLVVLDGIPYHRLLPPVLPARADQAADLGLDLAARLTSNIRPAVLHAASNYANARIALALGHRYQIPIVYEVRGFWEDTWLSRYPDAGQLAASELYQGNRDLETRSMLEADLVVTLGEAMRDEIVARGVPAGKVLIVPNAVSEEFLRRPLPDATALREDLRIKAEHYVVGVVTTLVPHEGIGTLLEATRLLADRGVPVRALIVGDGPERAALQRQAADADLGEAVIFTGRVPAARVREFHALLDVFVVPRTRDRVCQLVTPLKPIEAMASGLCVVTSEVKALTEIIKHEVTGALTIPQDPVSLADRLEFLFYSPDIRRKLGDNAREWVARDRTWAHQAERYSGAYARLGGT